MTPYEGTDAVHVVIRTGSSTVVLQVDGERGLVDVEPDDSFETPGHLPSSLAAVVQCVHTLDGGLLLEVDIDGVFRSATRTHDSAGEGLSA
jgi:chemotaxis signal transduction protein